MEEESGFDSVSWERNDQHPASPSSQPFASETSLPHRPSSDRRTSTASSEPQAGDNADAVDLAGIGKDGVLDCTVDAPLKENDGTKDAYVSYRITTHVCAKIVDWEVLRTNNTG